MSLEETASRTSAFVTTCVRYVASVLRPGCLNRTYTLVHNTTHVVEGVPDKHKIFSSRGRRVLSEHLSVRSTAAKLIDSEYWNIIVDSEL